MNEAEVARYIQSKAKVCALGAQRDAACEREDSNPEALAPARQKIVVAVSICTYIEQVNFFLVAARSLRVGRIL
jgi:hypothetical protein